MHMIRFADDFMPAWFVHHTQPAVTFLTIDRNYKEVDLKTHDVLALCISDTFFQGNMCFIAKHPWDV